ncbi:cytochrome P450 pisatin demethylase [Penicillium antarcticum]|uniref:cytochrome P450 pisatin demethylase n=1 Tax=Penicillium antarcticum TaxID=416450 RepID=UPI00238CF76A|nr:cytochrome P450 pisatin demethylase [Penicillium antarcticum]KAJ5294898.1 cytochrome P450 pisatin demethylase [Penicillium antarcticum]
MLSLISLSTLTPVGIAALILRLIVSIIRFPARLYLPGPALSRFTNLWYLWQMKRDCIKNMASKVLLTSLPHTYSYVPTGPIVRVAPNFYSISDHTATKLIYGHGSKYQKSDWYDAWNFSGDLSKTNLFSERSSKKHADERKKVASLYSMTSLVAYEPFVDNCIEILKQRLDEFASTGRLIDMGHWLQCYAFDVIGKITFGDRFGFLDAGNDVGNMIEFLDDSFTVCSYFGPYVWLYPMFLKLSKYIGIDQSYANGFSFRHIQEAKATMKNYHADLPSHMTMKVVQAQAQNPEKISDYDILATAGSNVGAGSDTTAISLSSILYNLLHTPACMERLREEMKSSGITGNPTFKETQAMPYLQAVMKEALRVHPATGFPIFRVVPPGGEVLAGQFFPEGTNVGVNSWVSHYDTNVYGPDAASFRPERWLEANEQQARLMEQNFMPFGMGSRTCIGKNIPLLEMSKLIPVLVRDFDFELTQDNKVDGWRTRNRWFVKPRDFKVIPTRRT